MNSPAPHFYDLRNARQLAQGAAEAYALSPAFSTTRSFAHHATDTHAILQESDTDLVVAFRGTADLRNWLTDLDCEKAPLVWAPGKVHCGFNFALNAICAELDAAMDPCDGRRIWVTGHSLGGALAMIFALRATVRRHMNIAGVYTFGQPRVGNIRFSMAYEDRLRDRTFRVVHAEDLVPRLPCLLGSFRHAGHEIYYGGGSFLMDRPWWMRWTEDVRALTGDPLELLADHHLNSYTRLLAPEAVQPMLFSNPS